MTNHWTDIKNADLVLIMGGNAAEAHPCGFKWVVEAKHHNKAKLVVVDPRFTRSAAMADYYAPIRAGTDIAFLGGVLNYLLSKDKIQKEYVKHYTNASFIVGEGYGFTDGIFSGYDEAKRSYSNASWAYELDEQGFAKVDDTFAHPRCVLNVMKAHYSRYTPEMVSKITGTPKDKFLKVCEHIASTAAPNKAMTIMYALGWTQHSQGSEMIRTAAIMQLLLGNIGIAGGGMNALRGHSNIQGLTDLGLLSQSLPGYLSLPREAEQDLETYYKPRALKPLRPNQMSYWQNYPKFFVSLQKAWWGKAATAENQWAYHYLPKWDVGYDVLRAFEMMNQGKLNGYICQGFNPVGSFPNKKKIIAGLSKLKYLVVIDPLATETSEFWKNYGEYNDVKSEEIQTTVFRFPSTCFAEEDGSLTNSGRWLQWHWKGAPPPGEAKGDPEIIAELFTRLRAAYVKDGGAFPDPIVNLTWPYKIPNSPSADELAMEYNGKALDDVLAPPDPKDPKRPAQGAGEGRRSGGRLRPAARRRQHRLRLLDLRRQLDAGRQPDGPARQLRPLGHRPDAGLGLGLAGQPPHPLQRGQQRAQRQALGRQAQAGAVERQGLGRCRRARHPRRRQPRRRQPGAAVHHDGRGRGAAVRAHRHGRRPAARTLRALREPAGEQPPAPQQPQGAGQPRGAGVQGRHGGLRQAQGIPVRGHQLPADRALPLLDQERREQRHHPAAAVRRDRRRAGQGQGHCQRQTWSRCRPTAASSRPWRW